MGGHSVVQLQRHPYKKRTTQAYTSVQAKAHIVTTIIAVVEA